MIGLPVAETCAAFVRWFPDEEPAPLTAPPGAASAVTHADEVRLMLDAAWHGPRVSVMPKLLAAAIDIGAVTLVAIAWAWMEGQNRSATIAMVALAYFSLATVLFGGSPAKWAMTRGRSFFETLARAMTAVTATSTRAPAEEPSEEPQILIHTTIP